MAICIHLVVAHKRQQKWLFGWVIPLRLEVTCNKQWRKLLGLVTWMVANTYKVKNNSLKGKSFLKAHQQISKKWCLEKYCSCDQACQFWASLGTPWRSYFENLTIDDKFINKQVRLFIYQMICREEKIAGTS